MSEGLIGVVIGAAVGLIGSYLQNRWAIRREATARDESRRDQTRERRRSHLIELRDATLELMARTGTDIVSGTDGSLIEAARMSMRVRTLGIESGHPIAGAAVELYDAWVDAAEALRPPSVGADESIAARFRDTAEELVARVAGELSLLNDR